MSFRAIVPDELEWITRPVEFLSTLFRRAGANRHPGW